MNEKTERDLFSERQPWYHESGPITALVLITLLALIVYLPSIGGPFVLDDEVNIMRNTRLQDLANFWPPAGSRYLAYLTFALNYALGGLRTTGYHAVNLALHIASALTLYGLLRALFRTPAMSTWAGGDGAAKGRGTGEASGEDAGMGGRGTGAAAPGLGSHVALVAALIFTVHPLNTQAVIYITQRFTVLASLFYLLSLYLYLRFREGRAMAPIFYLLSIVSAILASKTKEISFTLPVVIALAEYVFYTSPGRWPTRKRLLALLPYGLVLLIIPLSIFGPELGLWGVKTVVDDGFTRVQQILDIKELSSYTYLMTEFTVLPKYIRLFFLPWPLNLDYDYPHYYSFWNLRVVVGFVFLSIIFVASLVTARLARGRGRPLLLLASAGVLWFFITLSIESTVIPIRDVIFEHRMYLPGAGLEAAVAALVVYLLGRRRAVLPSGRAVLAAALIIITPYTALAFARSLVWSDGIALYEDIVRKSPEKARARNNLGVLYAKKGELDKAITQFRKTLTLDSEYPGPHKNLARALYNKGDIPGAIEEYRATILANPQDFQAHQALAFIYRNQGLYDKSIREYRIVLSLVPWNTEARNNLANIYVVQGRYDEAIREYEKILADNPGKTQVYYNLALALERAGRTREAVYYYRKFLSLGPPGMDKYREAAAKRLRELGAGQ
jgi:tetratricopeptide (TPR) repeat protein